MPNYIISKAVYYGTLTCVPYLTHNLVVIRHLVVDERESIVAWSARVWPHQVAPICLATFLQQLHSLLCVCRAGGGGEREVSGERERGMEEGGRERTRDKWRERNGGERERGREGGEKRKRELDSILCIRKRPIAHISVNGFVKELCGDSPWLRVVLGSPL